jgi:predicted nucleic-acid-binding Zn-ribbon protein
MKQVNKSKCPKCGSAEFITQPNRYDCLRIVNGKFQVENSEFINEKERIFCRECGAEIDEEILLQNKKVILLKKGDYN